MIIPPSCQSSMGLSNTLCVVASVLAVACCQSLAGSLPQQHSLTSLLKHKSDNMLDTNQ